MEKIGRHIHAPIKRSRKVGYYPTLSDLPDSMHCVWE